ncbi:2'-5' RNA ligase family protein [Streptomyces sp. NPDC051555]|uniref:2'-5' RNA ligase family protein n=1 Tax=Streptomyces sp. NPDC051555 TaxID=3365657 RepID=UPI0037B8778C
MLVQDGRAFPPVPPAVLDDELAVLAADWSAFAGIDRMSNHWARPGWGPGRRSFYWMITFPGNRELADEASWCQRELAAFSLDPVPADGMHITMNKIGVMGQVRREQLEELARSVRGTLGGPLRLLAHPMAGSRGAVRFTVTPWTGLVSLHAALAQAGERAGVPGGTETALFRPHLGIMYHNCDRPAVDLIDAVAALRERAPVEVVVDTVRLVELRREDRAYRWEILHEVALDGDG